MRVGVSLFGIDGGRSGISRYAISLLKEMVDLEPSICFDFAGFDDDWHLFPVNRPNVEWLSAGPTEPGALSSNLKHHLWLPAIARRRRWDALFLPAANRRGVVWAPCPTLGTVHDFSSLHVEGKYDPMRTFYIRYVLPFLYQRLTAVVAVSESTAEDARHYADIQSERLVVVPNAVDHEVFRPVKLSDARERVAQWVGESPYALYLARIEHPGKNHVRLIRAYERLRAAGVVSQRLVLSGSDWNGAEEVHRLASASAYSDDIVFTGFVPSDRLRDLYCAADAMIFPSLFEGFGLPILEAMACGVTVACSNISSMPEVAGSSAELFDPTSEEEIARAMAVVLTDESRRRTLRGLGFEQSAGFTWKRSASQTLSQLRAVARRHGEPDAEVPRKAVVA